VILVDSDVIIAHLRGVEAAREWLAATLSTDDVAISVLTITEVTGGMRSPEHPQVWRLLACLSCEAVSCDIARRAGELRRVWRQSHTGISTVDYMIAATALEHGHELATLNVRHYPMITGLQPAFALK